MRIRTDNYLAWADPAHFRQQDVFDSHPAGFHIMSYLVLAGKLSHHFGLFRGFDVFVGYKVIGNQGNLVGIKNRPANFFKLGDGLRSSDVVSQQKVDLGPDQLTGFNFFQAGVRRQNLFGHGHSHSS